MRADVHPGRVSYTGIHHFNPRRPIREFAECAAIMQITIHQAKYLEELAFTKLRAALSAYGYRTERPSDR